MATTRNIQMQYFNGTDYDTLYPENVIDNVQNLRNELDSKLNLSGGTLTGLVNCSFLPSSTNNLVNKGYVDNYLNNNQSFFPNFDTTGIQTSGVVQKTVWVADDSMNVTINLSFNSFFIWGTLNFPKTLDNTFDITGNTNVKPLIYIYTSNLTCNGIMINQNNEVIDSDTYEILFSNSDLRIYTGPTRKAGLYRFIIPVGGYI